MLRVLVLGLALVQPPAPHAPEPARLDALVRYVRARAESPDSLVLRAFESHHLVFVGDVHPAAGPKRLVARLIPELARRGRLDVLALEVPFEQQPVIDLYLRSDPEDVGVLRAHPLTLRAHWGAAVEYLDVYRAVWLANRAGARIRIVAVDAPRGPPQVASEQEAVARYARRDAVMASRILREVLEPDPDVHVLIFLGGYHGLKQIGAEVEWNGARAPVRWMATRLEERWPEPVYTILTDGGPAPGRAGSPPGATRWFVLFQDRIEPEVRAPFAVAFDPVFDVWPRPLLDPEEGAISLRFRPREYGLAGSVDAYLYLGLDDPVTPLPASP